MTRVELSAITRRFGAVTALHAVDLVIEPGEFFTLLGPSGSGKSTLLRILAGLDQPSSGRLRFDERDVTRVPPWKRETAMVFQNYALYPHMTVEQNIGYPLRVARTPRDEMRRRVAEVAEALQIGHLLARRPTQISGGQQQRVALARALVRKPKLFLCDEPLSNLDARMRLEARTFLKALQRDVGVTAVYVTHDQTEAMALSDRMAVLEGGHLRQIGTPREVYRRPATPFVATFVGSPPMSILEGSLRHETIAEFGFAGSAMREGGLTPSARRGRRVVAVGDSSIEAPEIDLPDGKVLMGIRPEDARWVGEAWDGLVARALVAEDMGHEILLTVEVGGQHLVLRHYGEPPEMGTLGRVSVDRMALFPQS